MARPRGGSGMLTQALRRHIEAHGGEIHVSAPVDEILVERKKATGIRVGKEIYTARAILAGSHVLETFGRLVPETHRPKGIDRLRTGNGFGAILRLALDKPIQVYRPSWRRCTHRFAINLPRPTASQCSLRRLPGRAPSIRSTASGHEFQRGR